VKRSRTAAVAANPVLIGAVTTLVVVVAVFLAYNANQGLPFVPTYQVKLEAPDAARLTVGNEVREGGERIGLISEIEPVRLADGTTGASVTLDLQTDAGPLPRDTAAMIRPRSALGLKYVDIIRGDSDRTIPEGGTLVVGPGAIPPELDDVFEMFDEPTRRNSRTNLETFGDALAGRGQSINLTLAELPEMLPRLESVMRSLGAEGTELGRFVDELEDAARIVAPVADTFARGFTVGADVFEALSRDPAALEETIAESPPTLAVGRRSLAAQRPVLRRLAGLSDELRGTAAEVRASVPPINDVLQAGTPVLRRTPQLNEDLETSLVALGDLSRSPTTELVLAGLRETMATLTPTLRYVGPHVTVCNYWNYWWTFFADHLAERVDSGTVQRVQAKTAPEQDNALTAFGASEPANGEGVVEPTTALLGDPVHLHAQFYGRAVDESGRADCESGQRGYPRRLASGMPAGYDIAIDPRTPGRQGTTFTGRGRVPPGQTFSAEPGGLAEGVVTP
jgi:virulence factor Mce-like protein